MKLDVGTVLFPKAEAWERRQKLEALAAYAFILTFCFLLVSGVIYLLVRVSGSGPGGVHLQSGQSGSDTPSEVLQGSK